MCCFCGRMEEGREGKGRKGEEEGRGMGQGQERREGNEVERLKGQGASSSLLSTKPTFLPLRRAP